MEHDVQILNCSITDDNQLMQALKKGFKIIHVIPYKETYYDNNMKYSPDGSTYYTKEFNYENNMIKYILERDGIARNVYG